MLNELITKIQTAGITIPAGPISIDRYGDSPELSASLIELIRSGAKRAGTSLLWAHEAEGEPLPKVGDIQIVVDYLNEPALLTRVTWVDVVAFDQVTAEYAAIEGEGDGSLEYWSDAHWRFFSRECARLGREPTTDMLVVCAVFELLACVPEGATLPAS
jgi:uncharacterized protein YhfF